MNLMDVTGSPVHSFFSPPHLRYCGDAEAVRLRPMAGYIRYAYVNVSNMSLSSPHDGWVGSTVRITTRQRMVLRNASREGSGDTA